MLTYKNAKEETPKENTNDLATQNLTHLTHVNRHHK